MRLKAAMGWAPKGALLALYCALLTTSAAEPIPVRIFNLPKKRGGSPKEIAEYRVLERFLQTHPHIRVESSTPIQIAGGAMDAAPLMAIAGGTSPDIIYVNFRQSDTYIRNGFLYPLDEYIAQLGEEERAQRIPQPLLPVIYREGADGQKRFWAMPYRPVAMVLQYRRDLFAAAGLDPERPPQDWAELKEFARRVSDPVRGIYGIGFFSGPQASWMMYHYLCSAGARAVEQQPNGEWRASFDTPEAVDAFEFVHELQTEQITREGKSGPIAYRGQDVFEKWGDGKIAMTFYYLEAGQLGEFNPQLVGVGPIPRGPTGISSAEINSRMFGIFAGQTDKRVRDAAWEYIRFVDSPEARRIFTETMVEQGAWRMITPAWLRQFGFPELARMAPAGLEQAYQTALERGTPEPYGKNCQYVYTYLTKPLDEIYFYDFRGMSREQKRAKIREFLRAAVAETNEKMLGILPPEERRKRNAVAWLVACAGAVSFAWMMRKIFGWMSPNAARAARLAKESKDSQSSWPRHDYKTRAALWLIAPALVLILWWQYWPLARGSVMAFQDYRILGESALVGINNFADVLFDERFWISLRNAFYFCVLWMTLGFLPPVALAIVLQEIPLGKILFRVLFYLPAVVSGVVILFMWRALYDPSPDGILNKFLGFAGLPPQEWLGDPRLAMFCLVFPLAWGHLGPGCIIYLAALKGIPDELYEAADVDGASFSGKLRHVVLPYLKPLLVINAVGAMIFGFKSADAVLAMTGGGPKLATHVVGYEIWERSFLFLQFGRGTAMAWILGMLLLAFTAYQLKILNRVEFRTTGGK